MFYCGVNTTASFHPLPKVRNTQLSSEAECLRLRAVSQGFSAFSL